MNDLLSFILAFYLRHKMASSGFISKLPDIAHRVTVLGLVGFTIYTSVGLGYTMYQTKKATEERLAREKLEQVDQPELK